MGGQGVPFPAPFPKYRNHFFCSRNSMANSTLVNSKSAAHRAGQGGVNTSVWKGCCPPWATRAKAGDGSPCILPKLHLRSMESD